MHDPLTGLANRTALEDDFRNAFAKRRARLRVLLIDLDGFKHVNDRYGHGVGDRATCAAMMSGGNRSHRAEE